MNTSLVHLVKNMKSGIAALLALSVLASPAVYADSGFYIGGSVGSATTEYEVDDIDLDDFNFDEDDTAWKVLGGFNFDILVVDLAVEAAYVNFGSPASDFDIGGISTRVDSDLDALTGFGLVGLELGPIGVFAKAGLISWDAEASIDGFGSEDDSGTDPAYGVGARFSIGSIELRAEYEVFDIDVDFVDSSDLSMLSVGAVWTF